MDKAPKTYPPLPKSYKGVYPFKLATTSFIYPDDYIPNVKMLGSFFDEIELLLFESKGFENSFPKSVIHELNDLSIEMDIVYSVHLPTDISISAHETRLQFDAIESYKRTIDRMLPLTPSSFFLHVPYEESDTKEATVERWRQKVRANLQQLLEGTVDAPLISVETLDYPVDFIEDIVKELNLSICMDVGHLILYGYDILDFFTKHSERISSIHLHGVDKNRDHLGIDHLPQRYISPIIEIIRNFSGILSIEVFSSQDLIPSLQILENWWNNSNKFGN